MKNKFLYLNSILLLFLFLVGFSPQANTMLFNPVYAAPADASGNTESSTSTPSSISASDFNSQLSSVIEGGAGSDALIGDISESITLMSNNLSNISNGIGGFALALSVAVIGVIGFKIMNSGKGNVFELIKQKKELSNAIICIIFITAIPYFVKEISNFQIPKELLSDIDSSYSGNSTIGDLKASTKSGLANYITENKDNLIPEKEQNFNNTLKEIVENLKSFKGIAKMLYDALIGLLACIIYAPIAYIAGFLGKIGFYPVSLDIAMYQEPIYDVFSQYLSNAAPATVASAANGKLSTVASGLGSLTVVLNLLYYIAKKFASLALEFVCYYYGVMHLLNKDTDDVGKFLVRLAQGLIGMTLFPYLLEFLLDLDGILAMSILRLTGDALPGFALLAMLPPMATVNTGFTVLVLGCCLGLLVCAMAKSFFVRRIEISLLYVTSPIFFLKHIMVAKDPSVGRLIKKITSAVFLTTVYAPVFAIISLMIKLGTDTNVASEVGMVYFMIIIGLLWMGKDVVQSIVQIFAGDSVAASDAARRFAKAQTAPADAAKTVAKTAAIAGAYGLTKSAVSGVANISEHGVGGALAKGFDNFKSQFKNTDGNVTGKSIAKGVGKTAWSVSGAKYATNAARNAFWEKYNKYGEKFDGDLLNAKAEAGKTKALDRGTNAKTSAEESKEKQRNVRNRANIYNSAKLEKGEKAAAEAVRDYDELVANKENQKKAIKDNKSMMNALDKTFGNKNDLPDELQAQYDKYKEVHDRVQDAETLKNSLMDKPNMTFADLEKAKKYDAVIGNGSAYLRQNQTRMDRLVSKAREHDANVALNNAFGALSNATLGEQTYDGDHGIKVKSTGNVIDSLNKLQSIVGNESDLGKEINTMIQKGDFSEKTMSAFTTSLLNNSNVGDDVKSDFINGAFNIDKNKVAANMQLHGSVAKSTLDKSMQNVIGNGYDATQVQSKLETFGLNNNANFAKAFKEQFNGVAPTATELAAFIHDQVGTIQDGKLVDGTIDAQTAVSFLSSAFNCSNQNAGAALAIAERKSALNNKFGVSNITSPLQLNAGIEKFTNNLASNNCTLTNGDVLTQLQTLSKAGQIDDNQAIHAIKETFNVNDNVAQALYTNQQVNGFDLNKIVDRNNVSTLMNTVQNASYDKDFVEKYNQVINSVPSPSQLNARIEKFTNNLASNNCTLTNGDVLTQLHTLSKVRQIDDNQAIHAIKETFNVKDDIAKELFTNQHAEGFDLNKVVDRSNVSTLMNTVQNASYNRDFAEKYDQVINSLNINENSTIQDVMSNLSSACIENKLSNADAQRIAGMVLNDNPSIQGYAESLFEHVQVQEFKNDMLNSNSSYESIFAMRAKHEGMLHANSANLTPNLLSQNTATYETSALHEGISYRSGDVATAQVNNIIEKLQAQSANTKPEEAYVYQTAINQATETLNAINGPDAALAQERLKTFLTQQANSDLISKTDLNNVAQVAFGFKKNQAQAQINTILDSGFVLNDLYAEQLQRYDINSETAALDYVQLISGDNASNYQNVAQNMAESIIGKTNNVEIKHNLSSLQETGNINFNNLSEAINTGVAKVQYAATAEQKRKSLEKLNEAKVNVAPLETYGLNEGILSEVHDDLIKYRQAEAEKKFDKNQESRVHPTDEDEYETSGPDNN